MGSMITEGQQSLLYSNAMHVYILFDCDKAGVEGALISAESMRGKMDVNVLFLPYEGKDPSDCTEEEIQNIIPDVAWR
jgi:DNA primase